MKQDKDTVQELIGWTPEVIVNLVGEIIWPIVILIMALRFKDSIKTGLKNFLSRNKVTEFSVGASGITAKIEASKQETELKSPKKTTEPLPEGQDAESIKQIHTERATLYSLEILQKVQNHIEALDITDKEKIEILCSEVSILQAILSYINITTVLFLSQYNLFNKNFYPKNVVTKEDIGSYFEEVKAITPDGYKDWDVEKYLAYPLSINMIEPHGNGYRLTKLGSSYIIHVRNNPTFIDYLARL